jgi:predicted membrane protein
MEKNINDTIIKSNNETFSKSTILIVVVLFMFSSKLLDIVWDIGKALLYIILIIYCLNFLNPDIANKIKEIINDFINFDTGGNILNNMVSRLSSTVLNIFKPSKIKQKLQQDSKDKKVVKQKDDDTEETRKTDIPFDAGVKTLENKENSRGRKLAN